jgi:hypothetical protein
MLLCSQSIKTVVTFSWSFARDLTNSSSCWRRNSLHDSIDCMHAGKVYFTPCTYCTLQEAKLPAPGPNPALDMVSKQEIIENTSSCMGSQLHHPHPPHNPAHYYQLHLGTFTLTLGKSSPELLSSYKTKSIYVPKQPSRERTHTNSFAFSFTPTGTTPLPL